MAGTALSRALVLRHHVEDDPGFVGAALERRGFDLEVQMVDERTDRIDVDGADVVVILGSKWSVYDDDSVGGWIAAELDAVLEADRRGIAVLGICFGAQALCTALGGRVEPAERFELGWVALDGAHDEGIPDGPWFQFHADQCLVPRDATVLARNDVCVQAFRIGRHLGVQFHPELDAGQFARWLANGAREAVLESGASPDALLAETVAREDEVAPRVDALVEGFLARAS